MSPDSAMLLQSDARFVFRVDASPAMGVGHAMRCAAIAEHLQEVGFKSVFVGETSSISWLERHIDSIAGVERVKSEAHFETNSDSDILVIDSYQIDPNSAFLSDLPWRLSVALVDNATPEYCTDLYIHPGPNFGWKLPLKSGSSFVLEGLKFVPIRRSMASIKRNVRQDGDKRIITIVGGGTDPTKFIENFIPVLESLNQDFEARVFTSLTHLDSKNKKITFCLPEEGIEKSLSESDTVITTAGISAWETASIGMPMGIARAVENQIANYEYFTSEGLALGIGVFKDGRWNFSREKLFTLLSSDKVRESISHKQLSIIDKSGVKNIVAGILKVIIAKEEFGAFDQ